MIDEDAIIDGQRIQAHDVVLGLPSSGFHTNGFYTLVRAALQLNDDPDARARLASRPPWGGGGVGARRRRWPVCFWNRTAPTFTIQQVLGDDRVTVHGMAHITGGGIPGNLARIIPDSMQAVIDTNHWNVPAAMAYVGEVGHISEMEQYQSLQHGHRLHHRGTARGSCRGAGAGADAVVIGTVSAARTDADTPVVLLQNGRQLT